MNEQQKIKKLSIAVAVINFVFAAILLCGAIYFAYVTVHWHNYVISDVEDSEPAGSIISVLVVFIILFAKAIRWIIIFAFGSGVVISLIDCAFKTTAGVMLLKRPTLRIENGYKLMRRLGYTFDSLFIMLSLVVSIMHLLLFIVFAVIISIVITNGVLNKKLLKLIRTAPPQEPFEI